MNDTANEKKLPSLRAVSFYVIGITLLVFIGIIIYVFVTNMVSILQRHERENIRQRGEVVQGIISTSFANIQPITRDWSSWDETFRYALGENDAFTQETLTDYPFLLHNLNAVIIQDLNGNDLFARFFDPAGEQEMPVPAGFTTYLSDIGRDMISGYDAGRDYSFKDAIGKDGMLFYDGVCYYVCVMPILPTDESGDPAGVFIFAHIYDSAEIDALIGEAGVRFSIVDSASLNEPSGDGHAAGISFTDGEAYTFDGDEFAYYRTLKDYFGNDSIVIKIEEARSLYKDGMSVIVLTCVMAGLVVVLLLLVMIYLVDRFLLRPLARMSAAVETIASSTESIDLSGSGNNREFHVLRVAINKMLRRLQQSKKNMEASAFTLNVLKTVLNTMDAYLYVSDVDTDEILFINERMRTHFNLGHDVVGGICWKLLQSGFDKKCEFCPTFKLREAPDSTVVWEEHNTVTGHYYRNIDRFIDWVDGKKVHLQHSTDITDIKLSEASIKKQLRQQELMSAISQSFTSTHDSRELIYEALKMAGQFIGVNQAFLSKYSADEGCLECLYEWYDEEGTPFIGNESKWPISPDMQIFKQLTDDGYAAITDFATLTHPNFQAIKTHELRAFLNIPIEVSGEFWGVLGFIITKHAYDWNESDIHLGKLIAGVFSGVISRNIAEENLLNAKEVAERASMAKGEFLSRMSHEMRTPMNAIIGMTGIAKNSNDPQKQEYCLEKIDNASKHLLGLINDILDMSKIEANKLELSFAEFDFEKMLINTTGVVYFRVEEKKQRLIINVDRDVPSSFIGDEMRLNQVITNLLTNAVKFTPEGGTITLNVHNENAANGVSTLSIEVIDNGIGISPEQQRRLFTSFEQADGGIARKYGGTGLGLAISKAIVELMGGRIWIESEAGKGSKFSFNVKLKAGQAAQETKLSNVIDSSSLRILAVDGADEIRSYFERVMSVMGLSCDVADSGAAAMELLERKRAAGEPYNVFFVDMSVPDCSGIELARRIKAADAESVVIMMVSGVDWSSVEKEAADAGIKKLVSKPLFPSMLINAINEAMGVGSALKTEQVQERRYNFERHTLLFAEDVEINREIVFTVLEDTKVAIDFAQNGIEALSMFADNPDKYDLVLMDIHMPEMDGYEATRRIRALDAAHATKIPIIAMTANVFREDVERCLNAGMNDHIGKPVNVSELLAKLEKYLPPKP